MRHAVALTGLAVATGLAAFTITGCGTGSIVGGATGIPFNLVPIPVISTDVIRGIAPLAVNFDSSRSSDDGVIIARSWDFGDGSTSEEIAPRHVYTATNEYTVTLTITDDGLLSSQRSATISVTEAPVAVITADRSSADSAPATINFDASSSFDPDGTIESYQWDFGDGSVQFVATLPHVFASPGTFKVTLTVTDQTGVTGTTTLLVQIGIPKPTIEIRVPPDSVTNEVVSINSPLWVQAVFDSQPGVPRMVRAGLDGDRDQCQAQVDTFNLLDGSITKTILGHADRVTTAVSPPQGSRILSGSDDQTLRLVQASTGALIQTYSATSPVTSVAISADGAHFAYGQSDGVIVLRDTLSGNIEQTFIGHAAGVNAVAYSPAGDRLLSGSNDRHAFLWNIADAAILRDFPHDLAVGAVAFSPTDSTIVATGSEDTTIKVWNTTGGNLLATLTGHSAGVSALAFSPNGLSLLSGSSDNTAKIWNPFLPALLLTLTGHQAPVVSVAFSPDGARAVTGSDDGTAKVWSATTGSLQRTVQPCVSSISAVQVAANGTTLLTAVAARNDIQLDTSPPQGNDLSANIPQPLTLSTVASLNGLNVPVGQYFLWAEIDTTQTVPVRDYANALINVVPPFTTVVNPVDPATPRVPLLNDEADVVFNGSGGRQVADLGALNFGDRIFLSVLETPGFGQTFTPLLDFSIAILDANSEIFAWYQPGAVLFSPDSKLVVGHSSSHYYLVSDGGQSLHVQIQRASGLTPSRVQRVLVDFDGAAAIGAGPVAPIAIPALDASQFNQFFAVSPNWGDAETEQLKSAIMQTLASKFSGYNIVFSSTDDPLPAPPYQVMYVGNALISSGFWGIADYIDPRNESAIGNGITFGLALALDTIENSLFQFPVFTINDLGLVIGQTAAHETGHLLGLRHTNDVNDIMNGDGLDPTVQVGFVSAPVSTFEQFDSLPPIGIQNAPQLLLEALGTP